MDHPTFRIFSAKDAKTRFGELLDEALGQPVGIARHDRLTAYVVSKRHFDAMQSRIQELDDQLWLAKAELARRDGFVGATQIDTFLSDFRQSVNDETGNQ